MSEERKVRRVRRKKPKLRFDKESDRNLKIIYKVVIGFLFILCARIAYINAAYGDEYSIEVLKQQSFTNNIVPYKRGDIKDRNGNVLATSTVVYNLVVDAKMLSKDENEDYLNPTTEALAQYFGLDRDDLTTGIKEHSTSSYWIVENEIAHEQVQEFKKYQNGDYAKTDAEEEDAANTKFVYFEKEYKRVYPYNKLACSVLGFANKYNEASIGIESSYNSYLKGTDGREYGYMDADNNVETVVKEAENGNNVISSIDMNIQRIVQKAVKKYMKKYQPERIAVVIADPNTGEILAMSDDKTFNLNEPSNLDAYYTKAQQGKMSDETTVTKLNEIWKNYCITDSYEPGSTAKPFTVAAAYEEGLINKKSTFYCDGFEKVDNFTIKCHKEEGHGTITVKQAIAESCNDYMMHIGKILGAEKFMQYQSRFGFGMKTGIDLPGETRGLVYDETRGMGASTLATNSFGQNFTVNMIQMVAGFSSLINGGYYYEPHVVKQIVTEDGRLVKNYSKTLVKQTVTKDTSNYIRECIREVVTTGTGTTAAIKGYTIGGKTGTAEKVDTSGNGIGRLKDQYILSFIGCAPCENPQVVCYTLMDTPKDNPQATAYNTELWTYIMKQVLPYLGIQKTEKVEQKAISQSLETEFYSDGIIEGDDGSLILKDETDDN